MTTEWAVAVAAVRAGTRPSEAAAGLVAAMTEAERRWCLDGDHPFWAGLADLGAGGYHRRPFRAAEVARLGIPGFAFSDGPRGLVIGNATAFPVSMARGATWDLDLEERIGEAIGAELRAAGADLFGGVCVNVLRHPAWGRAQETYGEDPHHVGEMGAALVRGAQRHVMATVKHFAANSMENARFTVDVSIADDVLHEVYLPHFKRIVDEGVACVMSAYNAVNGEWCGQSRALLHDVLREEWGFEGFVISDWIFGLRDAGPSVVSGLDVEMPSPMIRRAGLDAALAAGEVTWADIDACVTRTLTALLRYAALPLHDRPPPAAPVIAGPDHRALAREAAAKAVVVLRNEPVDDRPVLPLDPTTIGRVAVLGHLADARNLGDGGSSDVYAPTVVTPLAGLRAALPHATLEHDDGTDLGRATALAAAADLAVVVVGYTRADEGEFIGDSGTQHLQALLPGPDDPELAAAFAARLAADPGPELVEGSVPAVEAGGFSTGGDRSSLRLHASDESLIGAVAAGQPATVVAVVSGSAVVMEPWRASVPAIAQVWYSGMEGGHGLADVLLGHVDASGRMPCTIPTTEAHLPPFDRHADAVTYDRWHGYWLLARDRHAPAYPFGFGMSYTRWNLRAATLDHDGDALVVRAQLANLGDRPGTDVVQVYGGRPRAAGRPALRLLGFTRVEVEAGDEVTVEVRMRVGDLAVRRSATRTWEVEPGTYGFLVGRWFGDPDACELVLDL